MQLKKTVSKIEHQNIIDSIDRKDFLKVYLVGDIFYNCITKSKYFEKFKSTEEMSKSVILPPKIAEKSLKN